MESVAIIVDGVVENEFLVFAAIDQSVTEKWFKLNSNFAVGATSAAQLKIIGAGVGSKGNGVTNSITSAGGGVAW